MASSHSSAPEWIWSEPHNDYYYVTYDAQGGVIYNWSSSQTQAVQQPQPLYQTQVSQSYGQQYVQTQQAPYNPPNLRMDSPTATHLTLPVQAHGSHHDRVSPVIPGTPERGDYERLDPSYRMRTGSEAREFFKKGRVFSMLYSEAASETAARGNEGDAFTVVKFRERVYTQIRRFVIVDVRGGFVYACAISTYSGRGTAKEGCNAQEHAIVYFTGGSPQYVQGEYALTKAPIEITPSHYREFMAPASRLRFGKMYPIEQNVKVKDIGRVIPAHMSRLVAHWKQEMSF